MEFEPADMSRNLVVEEEAAAPLESDEPGPEAPLESDEPDPEAPLESDEPGPEAPLGSDEPGPEPPYEPEPEPSAKNRFQKFYDPQSHRVFAAQVDEQGDYVEPWHWCAEL